MTLSVTEIFYSIQGESLHAGFPCTFVRLAGCNLRCRYCDTTYAHAPGTAMRMLKIMEQIRALSCPLVELTGGEPLLQEKTPDLITALLDSGHTVLLETNGSLDIRSVDARCIKIVDIKCPGSGESDKNCLANLEHLQPRDQLKFVLTDRRDYEYAKALLHRYFPQEPPVPLLFSPAEGYLDPALLAGWILADHLPVRLQLQLHRMIWPDIPRGV
ncbi:MAG: radical SAM protein [Thermodesulfobacteriota bacterium]